MSKKPTVQEVRAAFGLIITFADLIREVGRVPSGELYARVMDKLDLATYNRIIDQLKKAGLIEEKAHELIWIGPKKEDK